MAQKEYIPQPLPTDAVRLPANVQPLVEVLAHDIHTKWFRERLSDGWTLGPDGPNSSPLLKAWTSLTDKQKESSRSQASESLKLVYACGYELRPGAGVTDEDIMSRLADDMARNAHEVWARDKMDAGWSYGEKRDNERKLHPDLRPYDELSPREKEYDLFVAQAAVEAISKAGCCIGVAPKIETSHLAELEKYLGEMGFKETAAGPTKDMMFDSAVDYAVRKGFTLDEITVFADTKMEGLSGGQKPVPSTEAELFAARAVYVAKEMDRGLNVAFQQVKLERKAQFNELRCETVHEQLQQAIAAFNRKETQGITEDLLSPDNDKWRLVEKLKKTNPDYLEDLTASWYEKTMRKELGYQPYLEQVYNNFAEARAYAQVVNESILNFGDKSFIGRMFSKDPNKLFKVADDGFVETKKELLEKIAGLEMIGKRENLGNGQTVHIGIYMKDNSQEAYDRVPMLSITAYDGSCYHQENIAFQKDGTMKSLPIGYPESEIGYTGRYVTDNPDFVAAYRKFDTLKEEMAAAVRAVYENPVVSRPVKALPAPILIKDQTSVLEMERIRQEQKLFNEMAAVERGLMEARQRRLKKEELEEHTVSVEVERKHLFQNKEQKREQKAPFKVEAELNIGAPSVCLDRYSAEQKQAITEEVLPYLRGFGIPEANIKELLETGRTSVNGEINIREKQAYDIDVPKEAVNVTLEYHGWAVNAIDPTTGRNLGALDQFAASPNKKVDLSGEKRKMEQELKQNQKQGNGKKV